MLCNKYNNSEKKLGNGVRFVRIRRITGYLAAFDDFNDGKRAELRDRVKHSVVNNKK